MSPLDRLLAEEWPTGTFGNAPTPAPRPQHPQPDATLWTAEEQATHRVELEAALNGWCWDYLEDRLTRPHLRVINGHAA
jgi:hypothetical protein